MASQGESSITADAFARRPLKILLREGAASVVIETPVAPNTSGASGGCLPFPQKLQIP